MAKKITLLPPPYTTQPGDVWENRHGRRIVVTGRDENYPQIITVKTDNPKVWLDIERWVVEEYVLIERDGKPVDGSVIHSKGLFKGVS